MQNEQQGQQQQQPPYGEYPGKDYTSGRQDYHVTHTYPLAPSHVVEDTWYIPGPETGKGPKDYMASDERIQEEICARLAQHGQVDARNIEVAVKNGVVTLTGSVPNREAKRLAERTAYFVSGVKDMHDQLTIQSNQQSGQQPGQPH